MLKTNPSLFTWQQLGDLFVFCVSGNGECVGTKRGLHLRVVKVNDGAVVFDHVNLLDSGDRVHLSKRNFTSDD